MKGGGKLFSRRVVLERLIAPLLVSASIFDHFQILRKLRFALFSAPISNVADLQNGTRTDTTGGLNDPGAS